MAAGIDLRRIVLVTCAGLIACGPIDEVIVDDGGVDARDVPIALDRPRPMDARAAPDRPVAADVPTAVDHPLAVDRPVPIDVPPPVDVHVTCTTSTTADFRLSDVTLVSSPDVRGFAVTSHITSLSFRPGTIHVDHSLRGTWPPVEIDPDGTTQEATIWVFFRIDGTWYGTGGERLRPNQTDKALDNPSSIGPDWLYDRNRWGVMTGYVPSPGELVGFMVVAGSTRSDDHVIVRERTGVVLVPFPSDGVTTEFPPFAWQE